MYTSWPTHEGYKAQCGYSLMYISWPAHEGVYAQCGYTLSDMATADTQIRPVIISSQQKLGHQALQINMKIQQTYAGIACPCFGNRTKIMTASSHIVLAPCVP